MRACSCCFLAKDEVGHTGDEGETNRDPGENKGRSIPTIFLIFMEDISVDGGCDHDTQPCKTHTHMLCNDLSCYLCPHKTHISQFYGFDHYEDLLSYKLSL